MKKILTALAVLFVLTGSTASAQLTERDKRTGELKGPMGRQKLVVAEPTAEGNWTGTWYYISRDYRVAMWLREKEGGLPDVKVQLFRGAGEQFTTDWSGHADYTVRGAPASFDFKITAGDEKALDGDWDWKLEFPGSARKEKARIRAYRTGDGRGLTLHFDDYVRTFRRGEIVNEVPLPQVWVFRKASKRLVEWDELPF